MAKLTKAERAAQARNEATLGFLNVCSTPDPSKNGTCGEKVGKFGITILKSDRAAAGLEASWNAHLEAVTVWEATDRKQPEPSWDVGKYLTFNFQFNDTKLQPAREAMTFGTAI